MLITVLDDRDNHVTLDVPVGPVVVTHGRFLHRLTTSDGIDHYFTPEGRYDGHGQAVEERDALSDVRKATRDAR